MEQTTSCTHSLPTIISWLRNNSHTKKPYKNVRTFWKKSQGHGPLAKKWQGRNGKRTRQKEEYPSDIPSLPLAAPQKKKTALERRGLVAENARAGPFKLQAVDHLMIRVTRKHAASWAWCTQVVDHLQKEAQSWKQAKRPSEHKEQKKTSMQANQRNGHVFSKSNRTHTHLNKLVNRETGLAKFVSQKYQEKWGLSLKPNEGQEG